MFYTYHGGIFITLSSNVINIYTIFYRYSAVPDISHVTNVIRFYYHSQHRVQYTKMGFLNCSRHNICLQFVLFF